MVFGESPSRQEVEVESIQVQIGELKKENPEGIAHVIVFFQLFSKLDFGDRTHDIFNSLLEKMSENRYFCVLENKKLKALAVLTTLEDKTDPVSGQPQPCLAWLEVLREEGEPSKGYGTKLLDKVLSSVEGSVLIKSTTSAKPFYEKYLLKYPNIYNLWREDGSLLLSLQSIPETELGEGYELARAA